MRDVVVSARGARRWRAGHPWIYRSDLIAEPAENPGVVDVSKQGGRAVGVALYSPTSEIRLRMLDAPGTTIDADWWVGAIGAAADRRSEISGDSYRVVHAEADGLPSLVVDRYGPYLAVQLLSAGLETRRAEVLDALVRVLEPEGVILRNDVPVRSREGLERIVEVAHGDIPPAVEVRDGSVALRVDLRSGQKTGAFLDQNENRRLAGRLAGGRGLDLCCHDGGFAMHMAPGCDGVLAVDQSGEALARVADNAALNGADNVETREANVFDLLRELEDAGDRFDLTVLDPPAFAKNRRSLGRALRGYKEINLRAIRTLAPGGHLLTFSCSYHVSRAAFAEMLRDASADAGRRMVMVSALQAGADHPAILTIPETAYLKGALLRAI